MLPSFRPAVPDRYGRKMSLLSLFSTCRTERAAHQQLLDAASAFIEAPSVQRLEKLQTAVHLSRQAIEQDHS